MNEKTYKNIVKIVTLIIFVFVILFPFKTVLKNGTVKYAPKSKIYEIREYKGERTIKLFDTVVKVEPIETEEDSESES
ncbi:MAG: hypothetical protein MJ172_04895 [Clostridia bacterium]|nr:hypothetical protein [Clostridia bacterium]